jgi:hypothetical protein
MGINMMITSDIDRNVCEKTKIFRLDDVESPEKLGTKEVKNEQLAIH